MASARDVSWEQRGRPRQASLQEAEAVTPGSIQQRLEPACVVRGVRICVEGRQAASAERRAASESAGYGAAS